MADLALIMPMAGRGTRFARDGVPTPKPLIELAGKPFFWWAAESVRRRTALRELLFVVLREHIEAHAIDAAILRHYPHARIVAIDAPTAGAAETAAIGVAELAQDGPFAINDCDHAFRAEALPSMEGAAGALFGFSSTSPAYSYVRLEGDRVTGTVEKQVVSPYAIAGCYFFADKATFAEALTAYRRDCPYEELFVSGMFNPLCAAGERIAFQPLAQHLSFGTPEELAALDPAKLRTLWGPA
ncbi:NTP transferase domain-containing protein [Sphingomonas sp. LB-2]|uniref:NTP transferase domain-containing protein n=1 Tax=Sphingomonas caeni TaxID=2984949 RepID=UPI00222F87C4|nr:NTP transferase domain-containing protein [Sphingomonas caeni]MCW3848025.1 NTP transferase domain-containing protein [Sphingomonas caeni]